MVEITHICSKYYCIIALTIWLKKYAMLFNILASIIYAVCDKLILLERKKITVKSSRIPHATSCGETEAWC